MESLRHPTDKLIQQSLNPFAAKIAHRGIDIEMLWISIVLIIIVIIVVLVVLYHPSTYDYIIVGAGISGCYMAYRLSRLYPLARILVLERSSNIGGRISSVDTTTNIDLEYGAMRYFPSLTRTAELVEELGLTALPYQFSGPDHILYLRGQRYTYATLYPDVYDQYDIPLNERNGTVSEQLQRALLDRRNESVLGAGSREFSTQFMNLYWDLTAYNYMVSQQLVDGWLEDESLFTSDIQLVVDNGYVQICERCLKRSNAILRLNSNAVSINNSVRFANSPRGDSSVVHSYNPIIYTGEIEDYALFSRVSLDVAESQQELQRIPAVKIFIKYKRQWWKDIGIPEGRHITDMAMNQFWIGWNRGNYCLLYASALNVQAWRDLIPKSAMPQTSYNVAVLRELAAEIERQVRLLFGTSIDMDIESISFRFWKASYRYWKPTNVEKWQKTLQAHHLVNSDYSDRQGWVEGALERVDSYIEALINS